MPATLRPARDDDYEAFTRLFPELRTGDPTPPPETWRGELVAHTLVAEVEGAVAGYLYFQVFAAEGIVRHLVVAPAHHGRRIGEQLMRAAAEAMRARGCTRWALNVKPDNASALRLYQRVGLTQTYASQALRFDWSLAGRLPAAGAFVASPVSPEHDEEVEAALFLPRGFLAEARALPGRVLRAVRDVGGAVQGAAVFVAAFPGAYPFRASSPAVARALLEALRPFARAEPPYMQVVTEGQPELAAALREAGAQVRLDLVHLEGPLPAPA